MTTLYAASLIRQAHEHWAVGEPVPIDLFSLMQQEGIDVQTLEARNLDYPK